jgi:hypothetical protein
MDWTRLLVRLLQFLLAPLAFGGCIVLPAAPVTVPLWLIWGLVALLRPSATTSWLEYTALITLQFLLIAAFGLGAAIDPYANTATANQAFLLYSLGMLVSIVGWVIRLASTAEPRWVTRSLGVAILILLMGGILVPFLH